MIGEGLKVSFCPHVSCGGIDTPEERAAKSITGTICYINWEHKYFLVEYEAGGTKQKEAFKFWHIGKVVTIIG